MNVAIRIAGVLVAAWGGFVLQSAVRSIFRRERASQGKGDEETPPIADQGAVVFVSAVILLVGVLLIWQPWNTY